MIMVIRHGEKPGRAVNGVTIDGVPDEASLTPRGWQRAGALVGLFAPHQGRVYAELAQPQLLIAPAYASDPEDRRTHQTIQPLSEELRLEISEPYEEGHELKLGAFVSEQTAARIVLICWEHKRIPTIAEGIAGVVNARDVPREWPASRFDLIWRFLREPAGYVFSLVPQLLLPNDSDPPT
jgi:broad specificity phosphatase PhoE